MSATETAYKDMISRKSWLSGLIYEPMLFRLQSPFVFADTRNAPSVTKIESMTRMADCAARCRLFRSAVDLLCPYINILRE